MAPTDRQVCPSDSMMKNISFFYADMEVVSVQEILTLTPAPLPIDSMTQFYSILVL